MRNSANHRGVAGAALAGALLLCAAGAGATEKRHPKLAPPGECATPLPPVSERAGGLAGTAGTAAPGAPSSGGPDGTGVAVVASLVGRVRAEGAGGSARDLHCGDPIQAGDRVSTPPGSSAGLLLGDAVVQLDGDTALAFRGAAGDLRMVLEAGQLRIIDAGTGTTPLLVEANGAETDAAGSDVQIAIAGPAGAGSGPLPALAGACEFRARLEPFSHLEPGPDVAAGGPRTAPPLPEPEGGPPRSPCDVPGSGCGGGSRVFEPPPTTDPFPGGGTRN